MSDYVELATALLDLVVPFASERIKDKLSKPKAGPAARAAVLDLYKALMSIQEVRPRYVAALKSYVTVLRKTVPVGPNQNVSIYDAATLQVLRPSIDQLYGAVQDLINGFRRLDDALNKLDPAFRIFSPEAHRAISQYKGYNEPPAKYVQEGFEKMSSEQLDELVAQIEKNGILLTRSIAEMESFIRHKFKFEDILDESAS